LNIAASWRNIAVHSLTRLAEVSRSSASPLFRNDLRGLANCKDCPAAIGVVARRIAAGSAGAKQGIGLEQEGAY
jgi:hypothetical protein